MWIGKLKELYSALVSLVKHIFQDLHASPNVTVHFTRLEYITSVLAPVSGKISRMQDTVWFCSSAESDNICGLTNYLCLRKGKFVWCRMKTTNQIFHCLIPSVPGTHANNIPWPSITRYVCRGLTPCLTKAGHFCQAENMHGAHFFAQHVVVLQNAVGFFSFFFFFFFPSKRSTEPEKKECIIGYCAQFGAL